MNRRGYQLIAAPRQHPGRVPILRSALLTECTMPPRKRWPTGGLPPRRAGGPRSATVAEPVRRFAVVRQPATAPCASSQSPPAASVTALSLVRPQRCVSVSALSRPPRRSSSEPRRLHVAQCSGFDGCSKIHRRHPCAAARCKAVRGLNHGPIVLRVRSHPR